MIYIINNLSLSIRQLQREWKHWLFPEQIEAAVSNPTCGVLRLSQKGHKNCLGLPHQPIFYNFSNTNAYAKCMWLISTLTKREEGVVENILGFIGHNSNSKIASFNYYGK